MTDNKSSWYTISGKQQKTQTFISLATVSRPFEWAKIEEKLQLATSTRHKQLQLDTSNFINATAQQLIAHVLSARYMMMLAGRCMVISGEF